MPLWEWQLPDDASANVHDLMRDTVSTWHGKLQRIRLDPADLPFALWRVSPRLGARSMDAQIKEAAIAADQLWYKELIIYQLHVKSFFDSNDDGIGDFPGLISKLDYIADLGVNVIWLLPFYPSPRLDDGYDISAYREVHPDYGTLADFRHFVRAAHARNLRLLPNSWSTILPTSIPGSSAPGVQLRAALAKFLRLERRPTKIS